MVRLRIRGDRFEACCRHCGLWREVRAEKGGVEPFFVHWTATFSCCGELQTVALTEEKDEIDVH